MQEEQDQQSKFPRTWNIKPKVYVISLFALLFVFRNLYHHFTDLPSSVKPITPEPTLGKESLDSSISGSVWNMGILSLILLVVLFFFRYLNGRMDDKERSQQVTDQLMAKEQAQLKHIKREKQKRQKKNK